MPTRTTAPTHRRPGSASVRADPDLRLVGLIALAVMLLAAIASMVWSRALGGGGTTRHGGDAIGATLAPAAVGSGLVVVDSVRADGAARRGGLLVGDLIETVDGVAVPSVEAADRALLARRLDIRVLRGKRELDLHLDATGGAPLGQQDPADRG